MLQAHPALQQLALSRNALGDAGLSQLCRSPWKRLQHLQLSDCGLTAEVCKPFEVADLVYVRGLTAAARLDQVNHWLLRHTAPLPQQAAASSLLPPNVYMYVA